MFVQLNWIQTKVQRHLGEGASQILTLSSASCLLVKRIFYFPIWYRDCLSQSLPKSRTLRRIWVQNRGLFGNRGNTSGVGWDKGAGLLIKLHHWSSPYRRQWPLMPPGNPQGPGPVWSGAWCSSSGQALLLGDPYTHAHQCERCSCEGWLPSSSRLHSDLQWQGRVLRRECRCHLVLRSQVKANEMAKVWGPEWGTIAPAVVPSLTEHSSRTFKNVLEY